MQARNRRSPGPAGNLSARFQSWYFLFAVALASLCGCTGTPDPAPNYHEYAYISNGGSGTVTVVDLRSLTVHSTVQVGKSPTGITANPRKNEVYVANTDSNNVSVIDAE